jgi:hypothetical protein
MLKILFSKRQKTSFIKCGQIHRYFAFGNLVTDSFFFVFVSVVSIGPPTATSVGAAAAKMMKLFPN